VTDPAAFRTAMGRWATGVSVVTASDGGHDAGLTVNALLSVSLRPPSVLVSLTLDADTLPVIERSRHFGVSVLGAGQRSLSERFARAVPPKEKFDGVAIHRGTTGVPLLDGALFHLECRLVSSTPAFDHHLLVGEVVELATGPDGPPLLFYHSGYAEALDAERVRLPPPALH
jgi:flavin reductase (DIM6/NTAB) family NADH-FMN oxidoreductase RutF